MTSQGLVVPKWPTVALAEVKGPKGWEVKIEVWNFHPIIFFHHLSYQFMYFFPSISHQLSMTFPSRRLSHTEGPAISAQVDPWEGFPRRVAIQRIRPHRYTCDTHTQTYRYRYRHRYRYLYLCLYLYLYLHLHLYLYLDLHLHLRLHLYLYLYLYLYIYI